MKLLDVNVWLAAAWARHQHHDVAKRWLWVTFSKRDDRHHLLWTDDYLAAFAQAADAELVTLDRIFRTRYPAVRIICLS